MKCAKVRYRTKLDARIALVFINRKRDRGKAERSAYRCPFCYGWHLTSK